MNLLSYMTKLVGGHQAQEAICDAIDCSKRVAPDVVYVYTPIEVATSGSGYTISAKPSPCASAVHFEMRRGLPPELSWRQGSGRIRRVRLRAA